MEGQEGRFGPKPAVSLREEVKKYMVACENLLSFLLSSQTTLTKEELDMIAFYRKELETAIPDRPDRTANA